MIARQLQKEDWVNKQGPHTAANYKARFPFHLCEVVHIRNPSMPEAEASLGHIRSCLKTQNKTKQNIQHKQNLGSVRLNRISYALPLGLFI